MFITIYYVSLFFVSFSSASIANIWIQEKLDFIIWILNIFVAASLTIFAIGLGLVPIVLFTLILRKIFNNVLIVRTSILLSLLVVIAVYGSWVSEWLFLGSLSKTLELARLVSNTVDIPLSNSFVFALFSSVLGATIWYLIFFMFLVSDLTLKFLITRKLSQQFPDILVINSLLTIAISVEKHSDRWGELDFKNEILILLEEAAINISKNLPKRLKSGDVITDNWFQETTDQFSASLRSWKKWVLSPKHDTRTYFLERIAASLSQMTSGEWDNWELTKPEKLTKPERIKSAFRLFRNLFAAFIPLMMFWLIQQTSLAFSEPLADYLLVGTFIWAIITFLAALDPLFNSKISTIKDIFQILPFGDK